MKSKVKTLTWRSNGMGDSERKKKLKQFMIGWVNYFSLADMKTLLQKMDEWFRRRIRMVIWKRWKKIKTRLRNRLRLGDKESKAWEWANTRKGYRRTANSPILMTTINNECLKQAGYIFFSDYYRKVVNVNQGTVVYRKVLTVVWKFGHGTNPSPPLRLLRRDCSDLRFRH